MYAAISLTKEVNDKKIKKKVVLRSGSSNHRSAYPPYWTMANFPNVQILTSVGNRSRLSSTLETQTWTVRLSDHSTASQMDDL